MRSMNLLLFVFSAFLFSCNEGKPTENSSVIKQTPANINGIWNLKLRDCAKINPDGISEAPVPEERFNTIWVDDSTISFFRYPYEFVGRYSYKRKGDQLELNDFSDPVTFEIKDSLLYVTENLKKGDCLQYINQYSRSSGNHNQDTVNENLLQTLKKDTINFSLLTGKWILSTERHLNDGSDPIPLKFSFKIPYTLTFPANRMYSSVSKQIIILDVNGKKRPFLISLMDDYSFWISPWKWEMEGPEMIYYKQD
jgi:hypothetical protein